MIRLCIYEITAIPRGQNLSQMTWFRPFQFSFHVIEKKILFYVRLKII